MTDVFITYDRDDRMAIEGVLNELHWLDVQVWCDRLADQSEPTWPVDAGEEYDRALAGAKAVVACWTHQSVTLPLLVREAQSAARRGVLVSLIMEPCELPGFARGGRAFANLTRWDGRNRAHFSWQKALRALDVVTGSNLVMKSEAKHIGADPNFVAVLRELLIQQRATGPLTVSQVMTAMDVRLAAYSLDWGAWPAMTLSSALDELTKQNRRQGEPPLAVLVVNETTRMPSAAFFRQHLFLADADSEIAKAIFKDQLLRVCAYDWPMDSFA